jgi:uncharacterized membrane protein YcaP (DUF421 family)
MFESIREFLGEHSGSHLLWWQVALRGVIVYLFSIVLLRLGKSRLLSHASAFDVVVAFMLGSILGRAILGLTTLELAALSTAVVVALHWVFSRLAVHSHWFGNLIKGHSYILVEDGKLVWDNLRRSHLSERDLYEQLRLKALSDDMGRVRVAYKERSGEVGFVLKPQQPRVLDIAVADGVQTVRVTWDDGEDAAQ